MMHRRAIRVLITCLLVGGSWCFPFGKAHAQTKGGLEFVGTTKCAACHFNQYKTWKSTAHGRAFEILPARYQRDPNCLKCHTTGFGQPTTLAQPSAVYVTGVNCEACHGAGSQHVQYALRLVEQDLTDAALEQLRSAIKRASLELCINCHQSVAHGSHPKFVRDLPAPQGQTTNRPPAAESFFGFNAHPQ